MFLLRVLLVVSYLFVNDMSVMNKIWLFVAKLRSNFFIFVGRQRPDL